MTKVKKEIKSLEKEGYFLILTGNMFIEEGFRNDEKFNFFHWLNSLTQSHDFFEETNGKYVRLTFKLEEINVLVIILRVPTGNVSNLLGRLISMAS